MFSSVFLRSVALCCLVFGIRALPAVRCETADVLPSTTDPATLKDILEFMDKLSSLQKLRKEVYQKLHDDIKKYCTKDYTDKFLKKNDDYHTPEGYLPNVFNHVQKTRAKIISSSGNGPDSETARTKTTDVDTIKKYGEILKKSFPSLYSAFYFLYFNGSEKHCKTIKGGSWKDLRCNQTGNNEYLGEWLTDKIDKNTSNQLIPRGFQNGTLGSSNGQLVAEQVEEAVNSTNGGSLQNSLFSMLFLGPWHDSKTGHGLLFVLEFCIQVNADKFSIPTGKTGLRSSDLKSICEPLKTNLEPLLHKTQTTSGLYAVASHPTESYEKLIKVEAFPYYVKWLIDNLASITKSLSEMKTASSKWTEESIKSATSAGPFKYGFVFKDGDWLSKKDSAIPDVIKKLTEGTDSGSLTTLLTELQKIGAALPRTDDAASPAPATGPSGEPETTPDHEHSEEPSAALIPSTLCLVAMTVLVSVV